MNDYYIRDYHQDIGQILKIKENILIGYQINLILNQMKIGIM